MGWVVASDDGGRFGVARSYRECARGSGASPSIEASNGGDALAALVKHRPSLIILDLMMPGMDGAQFREAQRRLQDHELADVPVLVVGCRQPEALSQEPRCGRYL
jgi:CheY-like chemotaxis protein